MSFNREAGEGSATSTGQSERCTTSMQVNVRVHLRFTERCFKARLALSRYSYAGCLPFASFFLIHVSESALRQRSNTLSFACKLHLLHTAHYIGAAIGGELEGGCLRIERVGDHSQFEIEKLHAIAVCDTILIV